MKPDDYANLTSGDEQGCPPEAYQQRWEHMVTIKTRYDCGQFLLPETKMFVRRKLG